MIANVTIFRGVRMESAAVITVILLIILYYLCLKPGKLRKDKIKPFMNLLVAHRGFFDNDGDAPENSLKAFQRAVERGYGIELDVQLTKDKKLVVFHDDTLERMCGIKRKVSDFTFSELKKIKLMNSEETIPLFSDVLKVIDGKVPLVVEVKARNHSIETVKKMTEIIKGYKGVYCMESFSPKVVLWFRIHCPEIVRGQLTPGYNKKRGVFSLMVQLFLPTLLLNFLTQPDFVAYCHKDANRISYRIFRKIFKFCNAGWTIKNEKELQNARKIFQIFIFDSFEAK